LASSVAMWYFSDTASTEHHSSTIFPPKSSDPEANQYFKNKQGLWLYTKTWGDPATAKEIVFIIHGFGEHCGRLGYEFLANELVKEDYLVCALDHQGHGKSNGTRAHVASYEDYLDDIEQFIHLTQSRFGNNLQCFIVGHSMGGALTLGSIALRNCPNIKGIILSGAAVNMHADPNYSDATRAAGKVVAKILPKLQVVPPLPPSNLSRSEKACSDYVHDPLVWHEGIRASVGTALVLLSEELEKRWQDIQVPLYIIHGGEDKMVDPSASTMLFESKASPGKKELRIYPEMKHEMFEDPEREEVVAGIKEWLIAQNERDSVSS